MKKARLHTGEVILAHQYDRDAHGGDLRCADPDCGAHMGYRKEALTHGSLALKSACFFSRDVGEHRPDCTAHEDIALHARRRKTIEQGLREGKTIVINLNVRLMENFNGVAGALVCQPSTTEVQNYVAVGAKSIEDVLDYMQVIGKKAGNDGIARTRVNYQGKTMPLADFVIDSKDKYRRLLNDMYRSMESGKSAAQEVTAYPRLIRFRATRNTKEGRGKALRGTPVVIQKNPRQRIVLLQRAHTGEAFRDTLRGEDVHLIARPALTWREASGARHALQSGKPAVYIDLHWQVVSAAQFTPADPEAAPQGRKPRTDAVIPQLSASARPA